MPFHATLTAWANELPILQLQVTEKKPEPVADANQVDANDKNEELRIENTGVRMKSMVHYEILHSTF